MQLYSFFNSSTSYRLRIALALKGLDYSYKPVNIRTGGHRDAQYVAEINPSASVPALVDGEFHLVSAVHGRIRGAAGFVCECPKAIDEIALDDAECAHVILLLGRW